MRKMAITMTGLLLGSGLFGCGAQPPINRVGGCHPGAGGNDCTNSNGDGVHIARTMPESAIGLRGEAELPWLLVGFRSEGRRVLAIVRSAARDSIEAPLRATYHGQRVEVAAITAKQAALAFEIVDGNGATRTITGAEVAALELDLAIPDGEAETRYELRLTSRGALGTITASSESLPGYGLEFRAASPAASAWKSYCAGPHGEPLAAAFFPGAQWNPEDGQRTDDASLVSVTCESGAVATCALWGYAPWGRRLRSGSPRPESLADYHQACIHLKRAAYCGTAASYTHPGVRIELSDPLRINRAAVDVVEAVWTPAGAVCLSAPRDPNASFPGCEQPLPTCPPNLSRSDAYLVSGLR